jgi:RNA polymerase sigma-70 factor (ECF subfamily)
MFRVWRAFQTTLSFDREWALTLLARGIDAVEGELREAGKAEIFAVLKPWLTGESAALSLADAAKELGMNEGAGESSDSPVAPAVPCCSPR